jgi:hypothetical protein
MARTDEEVRGVPVFFFKKKTRTYVFPSDNLSENDVSTVEMRRWNRRDKELAAISVGTCVGLRREVISRYAMGRFDDTYHR